MNRIAGRDGIRVGGTDTRRRVSERSPWHKGAAVVGGPSEEAGTCDGRSPRRWGVVLAGVDGLRLRSLTRFICGDDRPKQFCPLLGASSLVQEARQRAFHVKGFHEKPSLPVAERLLSGSSLWNTFVMVGHVNAFLDAALAWVPGLLKTLCPVRIDSHGDDETRIAEWLYDRIAPTDFSRQVLSPAAKWLITIPFGQMEWNDLGDPDRVLSTVLASDLDLPGWAARWRREARAEDGSDQSTSMAVA